MVVAGGERAGDKGYFVRPTVFAKVKPEMRVVREEIFGPVLVVMPYGDLDQVVAWANDTMYGLGASIWSNDLSKVHRLIPRIKAGTIWVNCPACWTPPCRLAVSSNPASGVKWARLPWIPTRKTSRS